MGFVEVAIYLILVLVPVFYYFIQYRYDYWKRQGIPHIKPVFPHGSFKDIGKTVHITTVLQIAYERTKCRAPFGGIYMYLNPVAVATSLELIKNVFVKDFDYFTDCGSACNERTDPMFLLHGWKWKSMREKLSPTLSSENMKNIFPVIVEVTEQFREVLANAISTHPEAEISDLLARFTTDVIGKSALGIDCNSLKNANTKFRIQGKKVFDEKRSNQFVKAIFSTFPGLAKFFGIKQITDKVHDLFLGVFRESVSYRQTHTGHRNDFMQLLLELKNDTKELTLEQIAVRAFLFFVGGFETSSTAMSFCLYELAIHQHIQEKLRDEINTVLERYKGNFTYEAMTEMKYMEQVVDETLRLHSPVSHLIRKALKEYKVPNSMRVIEKGMILLIPIHAIHMDPEIHEDPELFDPDRFAPENFKRMLPFSYLPFGYGPGNCVGLRFAKMQIYIGLITLLRDFKFSTCAKTQIPIELNVRSPFVSAKDGIILKVEKV